MARSMVCRLVPSVALYLPSLLFCLGVWEKTRQKLAVDSDCGRKCVSCSREISRSVSTRDLTPGSGLKLEKRWKGLGTEKAPWVVFTRGQWSCPDKVFTMTEMRIVLGLIALQYNSSFTRGLTAEDVNF
ncbi:unnamed protein product [Fusarium graminearum]|nr:unnamed protein product [Fusarium graminearum]